MEPYLNGSFIRQLRLESNLSQPEFANKIGVSKSTLTRIESSHRKDINISTAMKIAKYFDVKVEDLYIDKNDVNLEEMLLKILDIAKQLPKYGVDDRKLILENLQNLYMQLDNYFGEPV